MAVWCNAGTVPAWRGDGVFRFGGDCRTALWTLLYFSIAPGRVAGHRTFWDVCADARGLPASARTDSRLYRSRRGVFDVGGGILSGQIPCHASLDQVRSSGNSAV